MQAIGLNGILSRLSSVKELLAAYSAQVTALNQEYAALASELEASFVESKGYWDRTTAEKSNALIQNVESALGRIDGIANGLDVLAAQLCHIDPSYAKRYDALSMVTASAADLTTMDAYLAQMEAIACEAKEIASECSLTVRVEPIQELTMLFSRKRKEKYERLSVLIAQGKATREKAMRTLRSSIQSQVIQLEERRDSGIDHAAAETADLITRLADKHDQEINNATENAVLALNSTLPRDVIDTIQSLADSLAEQEPLPNLFSEFVRVGNYEISLTDSVYATPAVTLVNQLYHGCIDGQSLSLPAILDLRDNANFLLCDSSDSTFVRATISRLMYSLVESQPASCQRFILYDPVGRSQGFSMFLDFMQNFPSVMGKRIFTTSQQLREQIELLSSFIDEFSQTKLASNSDIFSYNRASPDRPESLKCLCLLNFPYGFDEPMLEQLLNIVKNGGCCGVQAIIHFDEASIRTSPGTNYLEFLEKIQMYCICLTSRGDTWVSDTNVQWKLGRAPSQEKIAEFTALFSTKYFETINAVLPLSKLLPPDIWFANDSSAFFSVPIGKDENGEVQHLQFGDPISKGTSHHALVTGSLGSGKSTLLHTIIMSTLMSYSPEEINLYLLDFKSGTEFQVYANYRLPHIKVIALDAMQEFGLSVLDELVSMMQRRLDLFKEEAQKGAPVKDINSFRKYTGKNMPRILVVADEFQVLFSEAHNRRVANACATRLADIISLYRVCGIHFVLATQTMSRLRNGFTISPSTLSEMHVRIGMKCSEPECALLFGDDNSKNAFGKMGDSKGTAVYDENYVMEQPLGFKVAFCDTKAQASMLKAVENQCSTAETANATKVFVGSAVPKLSECQGFQHIDLAEVPDHVPIYLGEPIRIDLPVILDVNQKKRSTLLVVGSNRRMLDQIVAVYIRNAVRSVPRQSASFSAQTVYLFDGLTTMGEPRSDCIDRVSCDAASDVKCATDVFEVLPLIDELYSIFEARRQRRISRMFPTGQDPIVHMVINDFQWIEPIYRMLHNQPVDNFSISCKTASASETSGSEELFAYIPKPNATDLSNAMDTLLAELQPAAGQSRTTPISYRQKLLTLLDTGYTCGINVVMSCPDFLSIKEIIYECIPKFQNKILFALSDKDADRIVSEAKVESLKPNIALFYDGVNPAFQFKPYDID